MDVGACTTVEIDDENDLNSPKGVEYMIQGASDDFRAACSLS